MVSIPFDLNDKHVREQFFNDFLPGALSQLEDQAKPLWGTMSAHQMIEHLIWAFEFSTASRTTQCYTPEHLLERMKTFLHDNRPTPRDFKNPAIGEGGHPYTTRLLLKRKSS